MIGSNTPDCEKPGFVKVEPSVLALSPHDPPPSVMCAFSFIGLCNQQMNLFVASTTEETKIVQRELHPKQEAAFGLACNLLGSYFTGAIPQVKQQSLFNLQAAYADALQKAFAEKETASQESNDADLDKGNGSASGGSFRFRTAGDSPGSNPGGD